MIVAARCLLRIRQSSTHTDFWQTGRRRAEFLKSAHIRTENKSVVTISTSSSSVAARSSVTPRPYAEATKAAMSAQSIHWGRPLPSVTSSVKRVVDIAGALVGLAIVGMAIVPIAIAIYLDSPGPIFFRQTRYGYRGKTFRLWKFRSMTPDAEARQHSVKNESKGLIFKNEADPRVTRVGRFLRRTSLDELPQFWNVLRGDMSLVGTRPPILSEVVHYTPRHWRRLAVKPGMTGKWQTSGRSSIKDFEDIVAMDLDYQRQWSLGLDLKIIFKTVAVVFGSKDAC